MTLWKNVPKRLVGDTLEVQKHSPVQLTFASDTGDEGLRWLELSSWKHHVWNAPYPLHIAVLREIWSITNAELPSEAREPTNVPGEVEHKRDANSMSKQRSCVCN